MVGRTGITAQATTSSADAQHDTSTISALWTESIVNGSVATANGGAYRYSP